MILQTVVVVIVLVLGCVSAAHAQDERPNVESEVARQLIQKIFSTDAYDAAIDWIARSWMPGLLQTIRAKGGPQPNEAHQYKIRVALRRALTAALPQEVWQGEMAAIYARYFTEDELMAMLRFYSSDVGQKNARLTATLLSEGNALSKRLSAGIQDRGFRERVLESVREEFSR